MANYLFNAFIFISVITLVLYFYQINAKEKGRLVSFIGVLRQFW